MPEKDEMLKELTPLQQKYEMPNPYDTDRHVLPIYRYKGKKYMHSNALFKFLSTTGKYSTYYFKECTDDDIKYLVEDLLGNEYGISVEVEYFDMEEEQAELIKVDNEDMKQK